MTDVLPKQRRISTDVGLKPDLPMVDRAGRASARYALCMAILAMLLAAPARAHEGHDDHAPAAAITPQTPRLSYQSERIESVALIDAQGLVVWVDDFASNRPLSGLAVSARIGSGAVQAQEAEAGTYRVPLDLLGEPNQPDISLSLRGKDWEEHYDGHLSRPHDGSARTIEPYSKLTLAIAVLLAIVLAVITFLAWRRRPRA
ncbi:MAG: hypothetical protein JWQ90_2175 [Hydrocarboniphaga sp.]|uniref:hypothetical protein n=1 Tax=Hydrocarboniphaga sp. TaxID=2033016 RepID=UPI0026254A7F|nr:hypothetical protein [Hydrocarboniphaga sp.]MDB5969725.1 hypothetical protein [Hydrocarboniphaga sp.]